MNPITIFNNIIQQSRVLINSADYQRTYRRNNSFSRKRKISFQQMIYFILHQSRKSLSVNISSMRSDFPTIDFPFITKQAISKARQNISHEAIKELFKLSVRCFYKSADNTALWNGYHIFAIDGSTVQIPFSDENIQEFGTNPNQYDMDNALASSSMLYDVMNDIIVDATLSSYRQDERLVACQHIDEFLTLSIQKPSIFLFDRGYPSYEMFKKLIDNGLFFLIRLPSSFRKLINIENNDSIISYQQRSKKETLALRAIHFELPDGTVEYLITNIMFDTFTLHNFKELYFLRWGIESKYKEFKSRFCLEDFSGLKPVTIMQDFYSIVYQSNLAALIKSSSDKTIKSKKSKAQNRYQANRSFIINRVKMLLVRMLISTKSQLKNLIQILKYEAERVTSIIRPERSFIRHKKFTRRKYYINMKPCL